MVVTNENMPSSFAAEALARVQSLQWGFDLGFLDVEVEGDPLIVIIKLQSKDEDKSEIRAYIRDGKILGSRSFPKKRWKEMDEDERPSFSNLQKKNKEWKRKRRIWKRDMNRSR
ncbi:hypothetical protein Goarm_003670 [Gossypium armourianum]|uniref:RNase H type-1 domain-containing protein n=1 Tax=Gossypium armourianum TaxID=34283 RepID=A0A7J9K445_9ROSI|nr:hypothetical protein [Gossypium armourianum]